MILLVDIRLYKAVVPTIHVIIESGMNIIMGRHEIK
jgi:hypothetical protein